MKQLITGPTRVTATSETLIDVIMTSNSALVTDSGVVETHVSDRYLVYVVLNLNGRRNRCLLMLYLEVIRTTTLRTL